MGRTPLPKDEALQPLNVKVPSAGLGAGRESDQDATRQRDFDRRSRPRRWPPLARQPWFRAIVGLRGTAYYFDVRSNNPVNSGASSAGLFAGTCSGTGGPDNGTPIRSTSRTQLNAQLSYEVTKNVQLTLEISTCSTSR